MGLSTDDRFKPFIGAVAEARAQTGFSETDLHVGNFDHGDLGLQFQCGIAVGEDQYRVSIVPNKKSPFIEPAVIFINESGFEVKVGDSLVYTSHLHNKTKVVFWAEGDAKIWKENIEVGVVPKEEDRLAMALKLAKNIVTGNQPYTSPPSPFARESAPQSRRSGITTPKNIVWGE